MKRHTISALVENRFGVLSRISGLFSGRGFNIDSLCVGETDDPTISIMVFDVVGEDSVLEQVVKQLNKLIDVIKVTDLTDYDLVERELMLIKVNCDSSTRSEIMQIVDIFRAKIVDLSNRSVTIEVTGGTGKINAIMDLLKPFGIKELVRTGKVAIARDKK
ncbi:MAG: acetolactate synthase small subunit [bacterium]